MLTKKQKTFNWVLAVFLLLLSIFFLFPVIWMLANSFKPDAAITADMNSVAAFIPPAFNGNYFENYITILTDTNFLRYMLNTLGYAALLIVLGVIVNGLAGYALAKINFPFRDQWLLIIMMLLIVPTETVITIHFLIIAKAGLLNTVIGYVLPMIVNPFNIFLFRQVFVSLPDDVYEAAQLDFCSPVKYFFTMVLPMSKTVVATVSVFTFLGVWNDYLWPSLVFTSSDLLTAQIGLNSITSNDNTTMGQTLAVITLICKFVLDWYLNTRSGYLLRAAGDNDALVTSLAEDKGRVKIIGLAIANGFAALAGGVLAQKQAFFDISIGTGTMVFGLASVILGTQLFHRFGKLKATTAVIAGAILYKACVAFVISMRIVKATDLKLITAAILLLILIISDSMKRKGAHHA